MDCVYQSATVYDEKTTLAIIKKLMHKKIIEPTQLIYTDIVT